MKRSAFLFLILLMAVILCSCATAKNKDNTDGAGTSDLTDISASLNPGAVKPATDNEQQNPSISSDGKIDNPAEHNGDAVPDEKGPQSDGQNNESTSALAPQDPHLMATIDPERPVVALTFDDGPGPYTEQILDVLRANGARATFFVVGNRVAAYPQVVKDIVAQGSEIGNHSWSHPSLAQLNEQQIREQLQWATDEINKYAGVKPTLLRPPYGELNDTALKIIKEKNMPVITWSLDTLDWKTRDAQKTYQAIMNSVRDGCIILCHDIHKETAQAMTTVIPDLLKKGYQLVTVSEMLTLVNSGAAAGVIYNSVK